MRKTLLLLLACASLVAPTARAYVLEGIVWGFQDPTVFVNLTASQGLLGGNLASFPLLDGAGSYNQVFNGAVTTWDGYLENLHIQTVDGSGAFGVNTQNNICEAGFGAAVDGSSLGNDILAVTEIYYYPGSPNTFAPTDIVFGTSYAWNSYRGPLQDSPLDLRRVALHELGHFIGLDHPDQHGQTVDAIMNSRISDTDDLTADDIAGGQSLYGGSASLVTEVLTYGDFNGDAKTDLLWRNSQTGDVSIWLMSGDAPVAIAVVGNMGLDYQVVGVADLDGDGKADIIWRQASTGNFVAWYMDGMTIKSQQMIYPQVNSAVNLLGYLDGDGHPDLLSYDPTSGTLVLQRNVGGALSTANTLNVSTDWLPVALADLDGDGKKEIIWRDLKTNEIGAWYLENFQLGLSGILATVDPNWRLRGVGKFEGRGTDSLVWHNVASGAVGLWNFDAGNLSVFNFDTTAPAPWELFGVGDFSGNGFSSLVWFDPTNVSIGFWDLNNYAVVPTVLGSNLGPFRLQPDPGN